MGFKAYRIKCMRTCRLPKSQQLIAKLHDVSIGNVLKTHIKNICQHTTRLLRTKYTPIEITTSSLLLLPAFCAYKAITQQHLATAEMQGSDHAVTIKRMVQTLTTSLKASWTIAIKGAT